jgi:hypothetical protein
MEFFQPIRVVKSGPAMTLKIGKLSIDLVPVFAFTSAPPPPIKTPKPLNRVRKELLNSKKPYGPERITSESAYQQTCLFAFIFVEEKKFTKLMFTPF